MVSTNLFIATANDPQIESTQKTGGLFAVKLVDLFRTYYYFYSRPSTKWRWKIYVIREIIAFIHIKESDLFNQYVMR